MAIYYCYLDHWSLTTTATRSLSVKYEKPVITDLGSISEHTFFRCPSGTGVDDGETPPKNTADLELDKFGECSHPADNGEPGTS
jgi:hypothetical protein